MGSAEMQVAQIVPSKVHSISGATSRAAPAGARPPETSVCQPAARSLGPPRIQVGPWYRKRHPPNKNPIPQPATRLEPCRVGEAVRVLSPRPDVAPYLVSSRARHLQRRDKKHCVLSSSSPESFPP
ncbi:hypothetical protein VTK73DRAFT_4470 [Phialemonium thermophilum]|uniref:Uncharacterized protein n=1 Tax=Phialemonium thermophilum TaxID=223376 RepID=A0ABR3V8F8_9PEZI